MPYADIDQATQDISWFFRDRWNRLCIAASAGGPIPNVISEKEETNKQFNDIVTDLPERYEAVRNEAVTGIIQGLELNGLDAYFENFESFARRGLYVFDRYAISDSEDPRYILVAYPKYEPYVDPYPIERRHLDLLPRTQGTIKKSFKNPFNLVKYFDKLL